MVSLTFSASFLPRISDQTVRYAQSGLLRYACRVSPSQVVVRIPSSALRNSTLLGPVIDASSPHVSEERIFHG